MLYHQDSQFYQAKQDVIFVKLGALGVLAEGFLPLFFTMTDD